MILVIWGHTTIHPELGSFIYSFHMPLFFFVSGILFHPKQGFVVKQLRTLGIPYLSFCLLSFVYWRFIELPFRKVQDVDVADQFLGIFYPVGGEDSYLFNVVMWFLPCLLMVRLIYYFIHRWVKDKALLLWLLIAVVIAFNSLVVWDFPYFIPAALCALPFFAIGHFLKQFVPVFESKGLDKKFVYTSLAVSLLIAILLWHVPVTMDMRIGKYTPIYLACFFVALMGILVVTCVSMGIKQNKAIEWIGKNSLLVMCCHEPIKRIILMLYSKGTGQEIEMVRMSMLQSLVVTMIIMICMIPIVYVINKWGYFLLGRTIREKG